MNLPKTWVVLLALLLAAMAMVPCVSAVDNDEKANIIGVSVNAPDQLPNNLDSLSKQEPDDGVLIDNATSFLIFWNEKMNWGLSLQQIEDYSAKLDDQILVKYRDPSNENYSNIKNLDKFGDELGNLIGLSKEQSTAYVKAHREQRTLDFQTYDKTFPESKYSILHAIDPSSQSAPFAHGTLYYLYILTDFQIPSSDGAWTTAHINDALSDAGSGTDSIRTQADSRAGVVNNGGYYTVTVSGENTGDNAQAWGTSGWMERAAQNIGYSDSNGDGRTTDDMARSIKSWSGADSVMLLYLTHDDKGGYAIGPDQGFADKLALSYWGLGGGGRFNSVPGSYEHEGLHLYGALDEYTGSSSCGQASILAVDPMHQFYTNTNHISCSGSTNSVMRDPYTTSTISLSSKRFIGWGDHDSDGTLDPDDSTP
jgi:hypothetical protein